MNTISAVKSILNKKYHLDSYVNILVKNLEDNPYGFEYNEKVHDIDVFSTAKYYFYVYKPLLKLLYNIEKNDESFKYLKMNFWITDYGNDIPEESIMQYLYGNTDEESYDSHWEEILCYLSSDFFFCDYFDFTKTNDIITNEDKDNIQSIIGHHAYINDSYDCWYLRKDDYLEVDEVLEVFYNLYLANKLIKSILSASPYYTDKNAEDTDKKADNTDKVVIKKIGILLAVSQSKSNN